MTPDTTKVWKGCVLSYIHLEIGLWVKKRKGHIFVGQHRLCEEKRDI